MRASAGRSTIDYRKLSLSMDCLTIYRQVIRTEAIRAMAELLHMMGDDSAGIPARTAAFARAYQAIAEHGCHLSWADLLIRALLSDCNPFTTGCAAARTQADKDRVQALAPAVLEDLNTLQLLACTDAAAIKEDLRQQAIRSGEEWALGIIGKLPEWTQLPPVQAARRRRQPNSPAETRSAFRAALREEGGWASLYHSLIAFHQTNGIGDFAFHGMFTWADGALAVVRHPDTIQLTELVDYDGVIARAVENTELFLNRRFAENALLFGARGTGKSSTVKAIANHFADRGLRLIELNKKQLHTLPALLEQIGRLPLHFIIFVDDLSFDAIDDDYNTLKSVLQGGSTQQPANTLIYVTTNRRHLVVERFADTQDDLFENDARQERLSLAERFGLALPFRTPLQKTYLEIVSALAALNQIDVDPNLLREQALTFSARQSSRSPRTAQQFIHHLMRDL